MQVIYIVYSCQEDLWINECELIDLQMVVNMHNLVVPCLLQRVDVDYVAPERE